MDFGLWQFFGEALEPRCATIHCAQLDETPSGGPKRNHGFKWFNSKPGHAKSAKAPSVSLRNLFIAVRTTVMESFSGSMKSKAFAMAMNTSVLILRARPGLRVSCCRGLRLAHESTHSSIEYLACPACHTFP